MRDSEGSSSRRGLAQLIVDRLTSGTEWFRTSLTARIVTMILIGGVLVIGIVGAGVLNVMSKQIFDRAVQVNVDQFSSAHQRANAQINAANAPSAGELQQLANSLVSYQSYSTEGVTGAALLRSANQPSTTSFEIAEPSTQSATRIRTLISEELRTAVSQDDNIHWQSVEYMNEAGRSVPGMIIGARLNLPGAGFHEFYVAYTLETEASTLDIVVNILVIGFALLLLLIALITIVIVRMVLRPVHEASRNASILAEGNFDARMQVKGDDELAQLARSFNSMASSLSEQFTQLDRMSKVQQEFVSAVSHELRSPVTTIRMAGQLIYDKRDDLPSSLRRSAELQHDQLINLDVMLSDLLEISRYDAGAMTLASETADVAQIVAEVINAQQPLAEANGVEVVIESRGDTSAKVEPRRIQRIVRNLVVNALEHAEGRPVRALVVGGEDAVAVEVSDRGIGLDEEHAAHVFDRFWRADASRVRKSGGTGLGLTIAREDAMLHGGRLQCVGALGVGSTFLLTIPRVVGEAFTPPLPLRIAAQEENWGSGVDDAVVDETWDDEPFDGDLASEERASTTEAGETDDADVAEEVDLDQPAPIDLDQPSHETGADR